MPYKLTFVESILGPNYKWLYVAIIAYKLETAYFWSNVLHFLGQSVATVSAIIIWSYATDSSEIFTTLFLGLIFLILTSNTVYWNIGYLIKGGGITKNLIYPTSNQGFFLARSIGYLFKLYLYYSVLIVGSFFLLKDKLIYVFEWQNLLFITLFLGLAFILRFLLAYLVGVSTFWTIEFEGSANFYENILPILAGLVFPFNLIQGTTLHLIMTHLPWSFIVYHPVQIYLGKYTPLQSLQAFVIGLLWALFLFYFSNLIFKLGLKKNESVGL